MQDGLGVEEPPPRAIAAGAVLPPARDKPGAARRLLYGINARIPYSPRPVRPATALPAAIGLGIVVFGGILALRRRRRDDPAAAPAAHEACVEAARRLNRACGVLAFSVLADSAIEHWRGSFHNPAMYVPLAVSSLTLGVSLHGTGDARPAAHAARDAVYALAGMTALAGGGFHAYNVMKRPGWLSWHNLFYGAPLGAPWALLLSGLLGVYAERVREASSGPAARVFGLPAGRALAALTAGGLAGTVAEAALLHFRGAYHNPVMFVPVSLPPVAAIAAGVAAAAPGRAVCGFARIWLRLTAVLGFAGVAFHSLGVQRNMGGWRNWSQNLLNGPPLPAPPSFTGLALAGLAALRLMDEHDDA